MTNPLPLQNDTYYHIYNRGTNRENIFCEERNYTHFLKLYAHHIEPVAETFAYCLLRNHFHLLIRVKTEEEIKGEDLKGFQKPLRSRSASQKFSDFFNAYAKSINLAYGRTGSLFQHPFGRIPVTSDRQFWSVIAYIHQNPQKHKFVEDFREWKWSSYAALLTEKTTYLKRAAVLEWFGGRKRYEELHAQWVADEECKWFKEDYEE
jgi:REP element-mobilizing transposase RayT